jgi:hypothetical protein
VGRMVGDMPFTSLNAGDGPRGGHRRTGHDPMALSAPKRAARESGPYGFTFCARMPGAGQEGAGTGVAQFMAAVGVGPRVAGKGVGGGVEAVR